MIKNQSINKKNNLWLQSSTMKFMQSEKKCKPKNSSNNLKEKV